MSAGANKDTVRRFFRSIEGQDPEGIAALFAEGGVHRNPYHSGLFPEGAQGRDEVRAYWKPAFDNFDGMAFQILDLLAMEGGRVFARYTGRIKLRDGAGWYENEYYSTFAFNEGGEIVEYVEIFNPILAARAFGLSLD